MKIVLEVALQESVEPDSTAERRVERSLGGGRRAPNPSSRPDSIASIQSLHTPALGTHWYYLFDL